MIFRHAYSPLLFLFLATFAVAPAGADTSLWYNGNPDGRDALVNGTSLSVGNELVYDNFIVPVGKTWTITSVYSNDEMNFTGITSATWQIRSGVSAGNGGTLLYSGDGTATQTTLSGYAAINPGYGVYHISEAITSVTLSAGTYWLAVAPDSNRGGASGYYSFIDSTSGGGAIGSPPGNDGNSYLNNNLSPPNNYTFTPTSTVEGGGTWDYSMGVSGIASAAVPAPSSLVLSMLAGFLGLADAARRRLRRRDPADAST